MKSTRLLALACFVAAAAIVGWWWVARSSPAATKDRTATMPREARSFVLVTMDTTRADRLQPYGADNIATPTLLQVAKEGIVFESARAVAPITLVAHTSLLSGLFPYHHGVRNNGTHYAAAELTTLAERLQDEGFRTAAFVSAAVLAKRYGLDQGFDVYNDDLSSGRERHKRMVPDRPAEATVTAARAWLDQMGEDDRFFLWVHLYDPHAAYSPPPPYRDRYRERLYDGEIAYMDAWIGELLEHPRMQAAAGTAVALIADHGESLGEHGEQTHGIFAYDATIHVPFLLRTPGGPAGHRVRAEVSQVDLAPTVLDVLDLDVPEGLDGRSLVDLVAGRAQGPRDIYSEAYLAHYTYGWAKLRALRRGSWKLIDAPTTELFDTRRDPRELSNVAATNAGILHDLQRDLRAAVGEDEREARLQLDAEAADQLRALGYLSAGPVERPDSQRPDPKDVIELHVGLERARALAEDALWPEAIRQLRVVLARDANNLAALTELAQALEQAGEVEEAVKVCDRALSIDPSSTRLRMVLAGLEARRGQRDKALELLASALEIDPKLIEAKIQRVYHLRALRRVDEAVAAAEALRLEEPEHPQVLVAWAQAVALPAGRRDEAEAALRAAVAADPFAAGAWRMLGQVLLAGNREDEAVAAWREALKRQPDDGDSHAMLGLVLVRRGGEEAPHHLREALRLINEFRPDLHAALGGWLAERGRYEEAQQEYARVLELDPANPAARNNRAIALYQTGKLAEAEEELRRLVAENPKYADAWSNLAAVAVDRQDWNGAAQAARKALALQPKSPATHNNLGLALIGLGRAEDARKAYNAALGVDERYWQARLNLGLACVQVGDNAAALAAFEQVVAEVPNQPQAHFELGRLYAASPTSRDKARAHLNAFLRLVPPRSAMAAQARQLIAGL